MSRLQNIENQIKELSQDELTALREWFRRSGDPKLI
jgi:hypothetical protein